MRFFHEGEFQGRRKRISPHLCRRPDEPVDTGLEEFYARLLSVLREPAMRQGRWQLLQCLPAWEGNSTADCFIAFAWAGPGEQRLVVAVNYAPHQSQCYVRLPFGDLGGNQWQLEDRLSGARYERCGDDLAARGLYLDVANWQAHVFTLRPVERPS
jgi:hypothetical protein